VSETEEIIDAEVTAETSAEIVVRPAGGVFAVSEPTQMIEQAVQIAKVLKDIAQQGNLISTISGREYMQVEAWTTLGTLVGCTPRVEWSRPLTRLNPEGEEYVYGWEAAVEAVNASGAVVGRAEAMCTRDERTWKSRDDYATRSMAQTRAMGKALRMPLGWIAVLAGYSATPAEEMQESMSRASRMRVKIGELLSQVDKKRGADPGTTDAEARRHYDKPLDEMDEDDLIAFGTELKRYLALPDDGPFPPFDEFAAIEVPFS
jgi:hypothetical protein